MTHILRTKIIDGRPCVILQPVRPSVSVQDTVETALVLGRVESLIEQGDYLGAMKMIRDRLEAME
jgi:hypothetical protein